MRRQDFCRNCEKDTLHELDPDSVNHILNLLITVFLCGIWLPFWIILALTAPRRKWRCLICGQAVDEDTAADRVARAKRLDPNNPKNIAKRIKELQEAEERSIARERMRLQAMEAAGNVAGKVGSAARTGMWAVLDAVAATVDRIGELTLTLAGGDQFMAWFFRAGLMLAAVAIGAAVVYAASSLL